jgi:hypothetical protein
MVLKNTERQLVWKQIHDIHSTASAEEYFGQFNDRDETIKFNRNEIEEKLDILACLLKAKVDIPFYFLDWSPSHDYGEHFEILEEHYESEGKLDEFDYEQECVILADMDLYQGSIGGEVVFQVYNCKKKRTLEILKCFTNVFGSRAQEIRGRITVSAKPLIQ